MLNELNIALFLSVNNFAGKSDWMDSVAIAAAETMPFIFIAVLLCLWFSAQENGKENSLYAGYSVLLGLSFNILISLFYFHSRPFVDGFGIKIIEHAADASFPSDHTTFLFSIALTLSVISQTRWWGFALCALAAIGGVSRIYCGVHYPFDIFGSFLVSGVSVYLVLMTKSRLAVVNETVINFYHLVISKKS